MVEKGRSGKISSVAKAKKGITGSQRSEAGSTPGHKTEVDVEKSVHASVGKWKNRQEATAKEKGKSNEDNDKPITKDISRLVIRQSELLKIKKEVQKSDIQDEERILKTFAVRKLPGLANLRTVKVLRKAEQDAPVKPIEYTEYAGPRFDSKGKFIEHSILGTLEDFKEEAYKRGEFMNLFKDNVSREKKIKKRKKPYDSQSLKTWERQTRDWQRSHQYLSEKVGRPLKDLVMRTPNFYPKWVDERCKVATAIHDSNFRTGEAVQNAKFYLLNDSLGEAECIKSTLRKSDKGFNEPSEIVGMPWYIQKEKGTDSTDLHRSYPVYNTPYLQQQKEASKEYFSPNHIFETNISELCITSDKKLVTVCEGNSSHSDVSGQGKITVHQTVNFTAVDHNASCFHVVDALEKRPKILYEMQGPALKINNMIACWEGSDRGRQGQSGIQVSLLFDGILNHRLQQHMMIENIGSTALHYEWTKIPATNSFCLIKPRIQRFYFLNEGGTLAPGEKVMIPVIFKSNSAGIFQETWRFDTVPLLQRGASIIFSLKAVVRDPWNYWEDFKDIEERLLCNKCMSTVKEIVNKLVDSIVPHEDRGGPLIPYISTEEAFRNENPMLFYHSSRVRSMARLYKLLTEHIPQIATLQKQPFSISNLRKAIIFMTTIENEEMDEFDLSELTSEPEDDWNYVMKKLLWRYVRLTDSLSYEPCLPYWDQKAHNYRAGYHFLQCTIDKFCDGVYVLGEKLNFPLKSEEEDIEDLEKFDKKKNKKSIANPNTTVPPRLKNKRMSIKESDRSPALSPTVGKESKSAKKGKKSVTPSKMMMDQSQAAESPKGDDGFFPFNTSDVDYAKLCSYNERVYIHTYTLLQKLVMNIADLTVQLDDYHI